MRADAAPWAAWTLMANAPSAALAVAAAAARSGTRDRDVVQP